MKTELDRMSAAIRIWMKKLNDVAGWQEWNRQKLHATLAVDDPWPGDEKIKLDHFPLPEPIGREHAVVMSFYGLVASLYSLRDCEYYFRRFPFRGLPVSHQDHLRYTCEMYFGRFYEFSERMKVASDAVRVAVPGTNVPFGDLIRHFGKRFKAELKERNSVNHSDRFEDIRLDNIFITSALASSKDKPLHLMRRMRSSYREATREWAERVRQRSKHVEEYLEAVATLMLDHCAFLGDLVPQISHEATAPKLLDC
jgi:hypothetical protein